MDLQDTLQPFDDKINADNAQIATLQADILDQQTQKEQAQTDWMTNNTPPEALQAQQDFIQQQIDTLTAQLDTVNNRLQVNNMRKKII